MGNYDFLKIQLTISLFYSILINVYIGSVLFPGGSLYFNGTKGYVDAGDIIYRQVCLITTRSMM